MNRSHARSSVVGVVALAGISLAACGGGGAPARYAATSSGYAGSSSGADVGSTASTEESAPTAMPAAPGAVAESRAGIDAPSGESHPATRPGLATEWGERRYDPLSFARFVRADPMTPFGMAAIRYNDAQGAVLQASRRADYLPVAFTSGGASGGGNGAVRVAIRDDSGASLPGQLVNDTLYVIGSAGQHYTISLTNQTAARFEAVVSVDGLDVLTGQPGSLANRGYLMAPYGTVNIEGFRQDQSSVAAFRFGSVADSYAAQTGSARNVGVIGVALFAEAGAVTAPVITVPGPGHDEIELRETAQPFPGGFARPPARQRYW